MNLDEGPRDWVNCLHEADDGLVHLRGMDEVGGMAGSCGVREVIC